MADAAGFLAGSRPGPSWSLPMMSSPPLAAFAVGWLAGAVGCVAGAVVGAAAGAVVGAAVGLVAAAGVGGLSGARAHALSSNTSPREMDAKRVMNRRVYVSVRYLRPRRQAG